VAGWEVGLGGMTENFMIFFNVIKTGELPQGRWSFGALNIPVTLSSLQ